MPLPPMSVPESWSGMAETCSFLGNAASALVGGSTSSVLLQTGVRIGAFTSKTTLAWLVMTVPLANPLSGATV